MTDDPNGLRIGLIAAASGILCYVGASQIKDSMKASSQLPHGIPEAPKYSDAVVPNNYCSRYVRLAAEELFGIEYPRGDAWSLRNHPNINEIAVNEIDNLRALANSDFLRPGMLVGFCNPESQFRDESGAVEAGYTHVALYLGMECPDKLYFADKKGLDIRKSTLSELIQRDGFVPVEVLFRNN